jgi:hypothetical protein
MDMDDSKYFAQRDAEELKQKREIEKRRKALFKKISSSKEEALKALKGAGIYDESGHLSEVYR